MAYRQGNCQLLMHYVKELRRLPIEQERNVFPSKPDTSSKPMLEAVFRNGCRAALVTVISCVVVCATAGQPKEKATAWHRPEPRAAVLLRANTSRVSVPDLAEQRLLEVYQLASNGKSREALEKVRSLVQDYPHFQLAQLVYGDMLSARSRPVGMLGDPPVNLQMQAVPALASLRDESRLRVSAAKEGSSARWYGSRTVLGPFIHHPACDCC